MNKLMTKVLSRKELITINGGDGNFSHSDGYQFSSITVEYSANSKNTIQNIRA